MGHGWRHPMYRTGGNEAESYPDGIEDGAMNQEWSPIQTSQKACGNTEACGHRHPSRKGAVRVHQPAHGIEAKIPNLGSLPIGMRSTQGLETAHSGGIKGAHKCK